MGKTNGEATGGMFYFLGFLGSAVYFLRAADSFWGGVGGLLKAFVWPAFLVYDAWNAMGS